MGARLVVPDLDNIIERYVAGVSLKQLSDETGYSRPLLLRRFVERGVDIRGRSEAERLKWSGLKQDRAAIERQCSAAWEARRGNSESVERKARRAITHFMRSTRVFTDEVRIRTFLDVAGFPCVQQFPIGPYNVDLALDRFPVAVEVVHLSAYDFNAPRSSVVTGAERLKYILDSGWVVIYIIATWVSKRGKAIDLSVVGEDLLAALDAACTDESFVGKYGVIWGKGKPPPRARYDFGDAPFIPGFGPGYE